jgi:CRP/FNR family cyclic AMP-dependent transcriptional regulator
VSLGALERQTFPAGTPIIKQGDKAHAAYVVDSGKVEIWIEQRGAKRVLNEVTTGGIFGEMALIDSKPRSANVTALSETVCIVVPENLFNEKIQGVDPLIKALLRVLVRNVRAASQMIG